MAAKIIAVSSDNATWYNFPGSSGDLSLDGASADDSIFGAKFKSSQATLLSWTASTNSFYKGKSGYQAIIRKYGTPTSQTANGATLTGSGTAWKVTLPTNTYMDPASPIVIKDTVEGGGGVLSNDLIQSINYFTGDIVLNTSKALTSVDYYSISAADLVVAREFSLTMSAETVDTTTFSEAQANLGYQTFTYGMRTVGVDLSGFQSNSSGFKALVSNRSPLIIEIKPAVDTTTTNESVAVGIFKAISTGQSGDVGGNEDENITFELNVPEKVSVPFKWTHGNTALIPQAVQEVITAWDNGSALYVKYAADGSTGHKGAVVVTDCSMSASVDGITEFSFSFQGTGALSAI
jgi:hypothetical protein